MPTWVLLIGLVAIFGGLMVALATAGVIGKERSEISSSLATIEAIGGPVPEEMRTAYDKPFSERVIRPSQAWLTRVARTLSGTNWAKNTNKRLDMAGNPTGWDVDRILAAKALSALILASVVGGVLLVTGRPAAALLWGAVAGVGGFFLPDLRLYDISNARSKAIQSALPDSIDLLTVCVESGLAFDAGLAQVAHNTDGPLAEEFTRVLREIQIGSGRSEALRALADRTDVEELRIFVASLVQAEKLGIPIADVLRVQAGEIRVKRTQRIEEQAMKLPVKMIFPLMFGIMPSVFIILIGPAILQILDFLGS